MKRILVFGLLILVLSSTVVWGQKNDLALNAVVAAEKAFAATAAAKGTRSAFLEFAAGDAVVFNRKPENAQEYWTKHTDSSGLLAWSPSLADVSADGSLGFTTGSWEFRPKGATDAAAVAWGEYFTIWKKQTDNKWKFELDLGVNHSSAPLSADWKASASSSKKSVLPGQSLTWQDVELKFSETLRRERAAGVYQKLASENIRLLREDKMPLMGKKSALEQIPKENFTLKTRAIGGGAAADFIYSYGEYAQIQNGKNENGYFARVWKRESDGWRIVIDVAYPVPPEAK